MTFFQQLAFFLRQCVYALASFSLVSLVTEWVIPGSVSPFLDPVPLAACVLVILCLMGLGRAREES